VGTQEQWDIMVLKELEVSVCIAVFGYNHKSEGSEGASIHININLSRKPEWCKIIRRQSRASALIFFS
jgi:hypothetical protein